MNPDAFLPEWCSEFQIEDARFATAYENFTVQTKAKRKELLAWLYSVYSPVRYSEKTEKHWKGGVRQFDCKRAHDFAFVVVNPEVDSAPVILSALMPILTSPIKNIAVIFMAEPSDDVLGSLELAGQEIVLELGKELLAKLYDESSAIGESGVVLILGQDCNHDFPSTIQVEKLTPPHRIGIYGDSSTSFDLEMLRKAHPSGILELWNASHPLASSEKTGELEAFATEKYDAVVTSLDKADALQYSLLLGPGMESFWLFPDYPLEILHFHSTAIGRS